MYNRINLHKSYLTKTGTLYAKLEEQHFKKYLYTYCICMYYYNIYQIERLTIIQVYL